MSTTAVSPADASAAAHADEGKFHIYMQISMILAVITGIEIVIIFIPFAAWFIVVSLVVLSLIKFLYVIFYFMHLRWDKVFCTILFFIGLVLAGGTMWVLLLLFGVPESDVPDEIVVQAPAALVRPA
jgi:cytochrome c oxidase subunit 4